MARAMMAKIMLACMLSLLSYYFPIPNLIRAGKFFRLVRHVFQLEDRLKREVLTPKSLSPPDWSGVCQMRKVKSVGWLNVSVWGFLGLLSLAGGITLASCRTRDESLWLVEGAKRAFDAIRRTVKLSVSPLSNHS